ncbi:hypothetical protein OIV83_005234 [Microbotryomycetes sp. JL201]|nr:hypothetical protein OIV83_005234 [Microbotryomycetes sp. JL201]
MAYQLIKALRTENIKYVVAPYEADPQLAYLERQGIVDGVISEDSDLLVFGCKTILFKLDAEGHCVSISREDFTRCREYNFTGWTDAEFRQMAILSGCDYLDSIPGMGLKTAHRLMKRYKTGDKVVQFVRLEGQLKVPRSYPADFKRAELTFLHQYVFDPVQHRMVHLNPPPAGVNLDFLGQPIDPSMAAALASGNLNPLTRKPIIELTAKIELSVASTSEQPLELAPEQLFPTTNNAFTKILPSTARQFAQTTVPEIPVITNFFKPITPSGAAQTSRPVTVVGTKGKEKVLRETEPAPKRHSPRKASRFFASSVPVQSEMCPHADAPADGAVTHSSDPPAQSIDRLDEPGATVHRSSPMSTPPRAPASKRKKVSVGSAARQRRDRPDGTDPFLHRVVSSDCAFSSPQDFNACIRHLSPEANGVPTSVTQVSSPVFIKRERDLGSVRIEACSETHAERALERRPIEVSIELSSDPITFTSEMSDVVKRKPPRRSNAFVPETSRKPEKVTRKRKATHVKSEDEDDQKSDEDEDARRARIRTSEVASAWKAKFMLQGISKKTPRGATVSAVSSSLPTPTSLEGKAGNLLTSKKETTREADYRQPSGKVRPPKTATPRGGSKIPLSPKSINRSLAIHDSKLLPGMTSSSSSSPPHTASSFEEGSDATLEVNPKLLKFRYIAPSGT